MPRRATLAASLALAGGVAAGVGSFLSWVEFSAGPISEQATGISGWEGKATLIASIVVVVAAIRVFIGGFDAKSRLPLSALVGGLVAVGVGLYTAVTARDQLLDAAETDLPRAVVQDALDTGLLELSLAVGLYIVIAGGVLIVLAALVPVGSPQGILAGSGPGLTGWAKGSPEPSATPRRPDADPDPWP